MKTFIVDDEPNAIIALENMIKMFSLELEVIGSADSVKNAIEYL